METNDFEQNMKMEDFNFFYLTHDQTNQNFYDHLFDINFILISVRK